VPPDVASWMEKEKDLQKMIEDDMGYQKLGSRIHLSELDIRVDNCIGFP
jgi:hypothetical protein